MTNEEAIEAFKAQADLQQTCNQLATDAISRQAAQTELMMKCERYTLARESHGMGHVEWSSDLISVADAMDAIRDLPPAQPEITDEQAIGHLQASGWMQNHDKQMYEMGLRERLADDSDSYDALLPSAQLDRDVPKKPNETIDRSWGISHRQAVCPTCDSYLGIIHFICKDGMPKVTYCETCGQAIDWEGWEEDG